MRAIRCKSHRSVVTTNLPPDNTLQRTRNADWCLHGCGCRHEWRPTVRLHGCGCRHEWRPTVRPAARQEAPAGIRRYAPGNTDMRWITLRPS